MSQRVIQWSTGNVGAYALRAILSHPELELAGVWVHSEKKSGRDAGELCGIGPVGVAATNDADALLELDADCVCYTATADLRLMEAVDDVCRILRSGKNVVSSSLVPLVHPSQLGPDVQKRLEEACTAGDVSVWFSGIDPGFANDVLPLALSGLSESWTQIRAREVVNYATYNQPEVVLGTMGFGKPMDELPILLQPGTLTVAWGGTIRLLAEGLGLSLDEIRQHYECLPAPRDLDTPMGVIGKGTRAALRFEVQPSRRGARHPHARRPGARLASQRGRLRDHHRGRAAYGVPTRHGGRARRSRGGRRRAHRDAPGERHPGRGRRPAETTHGPRPPDGHRPRASRLASVALGTLVKKFSC
jgi:4-hydroxy-tetrahydrodipicolinate reductase